MSHVHLADHRLLDGSGPRSATAGPRRKENDTPHGNQAGDPAEAGAGEIAKWEQLTNGTDFHRASVPNLGDAPGHPLSKP